MTDAIGRILIVEDDPEVRQLLADVLRAEGHTVAAAATCADACRQADAFEPALVVTDVHLPDGTGLEMLDRLRAARTDLAALVVTGLADAPTASEAARRGCADFLLKPLDLTRLRRGVRAELLRQGRRRHLEDRARRLGRLAKRLNRDRHEIRNHLDRTCETLTQGYGVLSRQFAMQQSLLGFQRQLLSACTDDDVFRALFDFYARRNGSLFGVAMVCDEQAALQLAGRFGMPGPDSLELTERLCRSLVPVILEDAVVTRLDGQDHAGLFPPDLTDWLAGVTFLTLPLLPRAGQLIGAVVMYRKGEQPFTDEDLALAEMLAPTVALAIQANAQRNAA